MSNDVPTICRETIIEQTMQFIHVELRNEKGEPAFKRHDDLLTTGLVDSLGVMRLLEFLEASFDVRIPMEDVTIDNFLSCDTIAGYVLSLRTQSVTESESHAQ